VRFSIFASLVALLSTLLGCATPTVPAESLKSQVAEVTALSPKSIVAVDTVRFGLAKKAWDYADFRQGVYAQTSSKVLLFVRTKGGALEVSREIPLREVQSAGIGSRGAFNHLKQLHLTLPDGLLVVLFSNYSDAEAGDADRTEFARKSLESSDVKVPPVDAWVFTQEVRNFVVPVISGK